MLNLTQPSRLGSYVLPTNIPGNIPSTQALGKVYEAAFAHAFGLSLRKRRAHARVWTCRLRIAQTAFLTGHHRATMYQARTRRPFIVEIKSTRRTARNKEFTSIWAGTDIGAANHAISGESVMQEVLVENAIVERETNVQKRTNNRRS